MPKNDNVHEGHRTRLRKRYIAEGGIENFEDHQILELLLFYSYHARMDTNGVAHKILNAFNGSLTDVFKASPYELMRRCGLSEKVAVQLSLVSDLAEYYIKNTSLPSKYLDAPETVLAYLRPQFEKDRDAKEVFHILCMGIKNHRKVLIKDLVIASGKDNSVEITMKDVVERVLKEEAIFIILAHNHPNGNCRPSNNDIATTTAIKNYIEPLGIKVLDHIIICKDTFFSFAAHKLCEMKLNTQTNNSY